MASKATPFLIAVCGHSALGSRHFDAQNRSLKAFQARSRPIHRLPGHLDPRNRLSTFTRAGAASAYTWDANGNRLTSIETTRADTDLDGAFDAEDFSATTAQSLTIAEGSNRLLGFTQTLSRTQGTRTLSTTSAQVAYSLDGAGNLTSDGLRSFNHDASGRLAQVRIGLGSEEAATTYLHNALGQRVFKSEPQATQYAPDEEELGSDFIAWLKKNFGWLFARAQANATLGQSFVYADAPLPEWALLGEYGNGGSKSAGRLEVIWLPTEDGGAIPIGLYRNGRFHAVHPDHLGTPRLITDEANLPVWQWPYSAFGANKPTGILKATQKPKQAYTNEPVLLKATNPALTFNLRFPGQYFDEESNLNYNYFRNYMPTQGRYSQADPIGLEGGLNRFGYGNLNVISNSDPFGLYSWSDAPSALAHYCTGNGSDWTTSIETLNFGDVKGRLNKKIKEQVGEMCLNRTLQIDFVTESQTEGADSKIIGRHNLRVKGTVIMKCDCTWQFSGKMKSDQGFDTYNFNRSNRDASAETQTTIGRNLCKGTAFRINILGELPVNIIGKSGGHSTCCNSTTGCCK